MIETIDAKSIPQFENCKRRHLDLISVRHHPGFGVERSREFIEVEGEVENLVVEDCRVAEIACM